VSPAFTVPLPVLVTWTFGQMTVSVAEALLFARLAEASFVEATTTVFGRVPQSAGTVRRDSVTVLVAPLAIVPKVQSIAPETGLLPQAAASAPPIVQLPLGRVSCAVTLKAVPGPRLVTVIVNVAVAPALMVPLPVFVTVRSGQMTWSVKLAVLS